MRKKLKPVNCKWCGNEFIRWNSTQVNCSPTCAISYVKDKEDKKLRRAVSVSKAIERKDLKRRKEALKSKSQWLKEAQTAFNAYIRKRDEGDACISCQKPPKKKNAGHYKSTGSHPELRFNEFNVHLQCEHCNTYKSGNQVQYRINLIKKIGEKNVDLLEMKHPPLKLDIDQIKEIKQKYAKKVREMK